MRVNGGKGGSGVFQRIISLMPAHTVYIEAHLGAGNILRRKRPAARSYAIEIDPETLAAFRATYGRELASVEYVHGDCVSWLQDFKHRCTGRELVYSDPPYVLSSRRSLKRLYRYEYTEQDHQRLLGIFLELKCYVMISGYENPLYEELLTGWHKVSFTAQTRGGPAIETLWMSFDPDQVLKHDYEHTGAGYRERERIKKKARRWANRLNGMPADERNYLLRLIADQFGGEVRFHAGHADSGIAGTDGISGYTTKDDDASRSIIES